MIVKNEKSMMIFVRLLIMRPLLLNGEMLRNFKRSKNLDLYGCLLCMALTMMYNSTLTFDIGPS